MKIICIHTTETILLATILLAASLSCSSCRKYETDYRDGHTEIRKVSKMDWGEKAHTVTDEKLPKLKPLLDATLADIKTQWGEELKYIEKNGFRVETIWWDTTHNSIYDIRNKKLWVTVHEWYDTIKEFSLK